MQIEDGALQRGRWVSDLKHDLIERGYDSKDVEELITAALDRFRSSRVQDFIPLLVSRSVEQTLRER